MRLFTLSVNCLSKPFIHVGIKLSLSKNSVVIYLVFWWVASLFSLSSYAEINVTDYAGRELVLQKPAQRIVALAPHIVENLYSAGAGEHIVGVVDYCDYPVQARKIVKVGAISAFSLEAIVTLKPDLVIVWYSGNGTKYLKKLNALGVPVYASNPKSLNDIARSIRDYGKLAGSEDIANVQAELFMSQYSDLHNAYSKKPQVSVFYQVWNDPLQTLNGDHIISDVIRMCGGKNIFAAEKSIAPKISLEAIVARNPEVIIASGMGEEKPEWLDDWRRFDGLTAVKQNNLYVVPPDLIQRHTARILLGAKTMCQQLEQVRLKRSR